MIQQNYPPIRTVPARLRKGGAASEREIFRQLTRVFTEPKNKGEGQGPKGTGPYAEEEEEEEVLQEKKREQ